ncbi:MAG: beta-phosphoglucomutase [Prolixibacteraceae bacterium]|nr:beta-phosphoglucomutase [Prolixibacteraceae bacterium]
MKIKACLFDLDGVIVDTAKYHYIAWKEMAAGLGFDFTEKENELLKGVSRMHSLDILLDIGKVTKTEEEKQVLAEKKNQLYLDYVKRMDEVEILPGVTQFLDDLRSNGILIALGSASKNAPLILERIHLEGKFDVIVDGNSISSAKPDPEVFLKGAELLMVNPAECLVFEDAQAGIEAALNGGMKVIGVGSSVNLSHADHYIPGFDKLDYELLSKWYQKEDMSYEL